MKDPNLYINHSNNQYFSINIAKNIEAKRRKNVDVVYMKCENRNYHLQELQFSRDEFDRLIKNKVLEVVKHG
jgi:hypothetical protein